MLLALRVFNKKKNEFDYLLINKGYIYVNLGDTRCMTKWKFFFSCLANLNYYPIKCV